MSQKYVAGVVVVFILAVVAFLSSRQAAQPVAPGIGDEAPAMTIVPTSHDDMMPAPQIAQEPSTAAPQPPIPVEEKIKTMKIVSIEEFREEARANPHLPSSLGIRSAVQLGELYDLVLSEKDAVEAFAYYKSCLVKPVPNALKASCYRYTQQLANRYPTLKGELGSANNLLNDEVRKILSMDRR